MLKTKDGMTAGLNDHIYVIANSRKINRAGKVFVPQNKKEVSLFEMNIHTITNTICYNPNTEKLEEATFAQGLCYDAGASREEAAARFYDGIQATTMNSFASEAAARSALPEFQRRGFVSYCDGINSFEDR